MICAKGLWVNARRLRAALGLDDGYASDMIRVMHERTEKRNVSKSMNSVPIGDFFEQYEWAAEEIEPGVWRSTFTTEGEEDFDLYVMVVDEWLHFAVSPLVHVGETEAHARLITSLLRLNQQMRLVRLGLDDEGDLNLVADAPRARFDFGDFALILDLLTEYASALARELQRSVDDVNYYSPLLPSI
jgi:hypothetical protein